MTQRLRRERKEALGARVDLEDQLRVLQEMINGAHMQDGAVPAREVADGGLMAAVGNAGGGPTAAASSAGGGPTAAVGNVGTGLARRGGSFPPILDLSGPPVGGALGGFGSGLGGGGSSGFPWFPPLGGDRHSLPRPRMMRTVLAVVEVGLLLPLLLRLVCPMEGSQWDNLLCLVPM